MVALSEIEIQDEFLLVRIQGGAFRPIDIMSTISKIRKSLKESKKNRILVVRQVPVKIITSLFYLYKLAEYLMFQDISNFKVALVFPEEMHTENMKLFVMASQNRGLKFCLFSEYNDGEAWLMSPDPVISD